MNWLRQLFAGKPTLSPEQAARLAAWQALPEPSMQQPIEQSRFVVVDVESSGLNIAKDRLISIGAVAIVNGKIRLGDCIEVVLQQKAVSGKENILVHGIGGTAQREGMPPAEALLAFLEYLGKDPLIAFHSAFDEAMIVRAIKEYLDFKFRHIWADLAYIAPGLYPRLASRHRSLDQWMDQFGIGNFARHNALADAQSTAELLLVLRGAMAAKSIRNIRDMRALEKSQRPEHLGI